MTPETYEKVLAQIAATGETDPASIATCGTCGFQWDDSMSTSLTPAPGARCPNEYNHADAWGYKGIDVYPTAERGGYRWEAPSPWGTLLAGSKQSMREQITATMAAHGVTSFRKFRKGRGQRNG